MNLSKHIIAFIAIVLVNTLTSFAQVVTIETLIDTHKIEIGSKLELTYQVKKSSDRIVYLPTIKDTLIEGVELLEVPVVDSTKLKNGDIQITQKLVLTSFEEGTYFIPPQPFGLQTEFGVDTIHSKESYFEVVGVALDTTGVIRANAGIHRAPVTFRDFLPLIILIAIAGLIVLIVYLVKKYKKGKGLLPIPDKPADPPHIIALRELDKLKAQKLWQQDQLKEYYSRLTNIIRAYIEERYGVLALEKPTSEILRELRLIDDAVRKEFPKLESLLNLADLIKFAKGSADADENLEHLENAYSFVKTTYTNQEGEIEEEGGEK